MIRLISAGTLAALLSLPAAAHVTLEREEAAVNAPYKGVLRVPHGCEKSATTAIRVLLPDGVVGVKPMPKPGWTLTTVTVKYRQPAKVYHSELTEGVGEITWAGGKLPDSWYDEFVFMSFISSGLEAGKTIYFPVVQECENGVHRWIEIPEPGKSRADYASPAPGLRLLPGVTPRR